MRLLRGASRTLDVCITGAVQQAFNSLVVKVISQIANNLPAHSTWTLSPLQELAHQRGFSSLHGGMGIALQIHSAACQRDKTRIRMNPVGSRRIEIRTQESTKF
jgi:hypothetical protein